MISLTFLFLKFNIIKTFLMKWDDTSWGALIGRSLENPSGETLLRKWYQNLWQEAKVFDYEKVFLGGVVFREAKGGQREELEQICVESKKVYVGVCICVCVYVRVFLCIKL